MLEEIALLHEDSMDEQPDNPKQLTNSNKGMEQNKKMKVVSMLENVFQKLNRYVFLFLADVRPPGKSSRKQRTKKRNTWGSKLSQCVPFVKESEQMV